MDSFKIKTIKKIKKIKKIELLVLDVDGVLTDGKIMLTPTGEEIKSFHVRDGAGMKYWKRAGKKLAIITGRGSPAVEIRAKDLDVDIVRMNAKIKLPVLEDVLSELGISADKTAVIGDDLTDIPLFTRCGFSIAVADAADEAAETADYITKLPGGSGAVREAIEMLLKNEGLWDSILERYLPHEGSSHK